MQLALPSASTETLLVIELRLYFQMRHAYKYRLCFPASSCLLLIWVHQTFICAAWGLHWLHAMIASHRMQLITGESSMVLLSCLTRDTWKEALTLLEIQKWPLAVWLLSLSSCESSYKPQQATWLLTRVIIAADHYSPGCPVDCNTVSVVWSIIRWPQLLPLFVRHTYLKHDHLLDCKQLGHSLLTVKRPRLLTSEPRA